MQRNEIKENDTHTKLLSTTIHLWNVFIIISSLGDQDKMCPALQTSLFSPFWSFDFPPSTTWGSKQSTCWTPLSMKNIKNGFRDKTNIMKINNCNTKNITISKSHISIAGYIVPTATKFPATSSENQHREDEKYNNTI